MARIVFLTSSYYSIFSAISLAKIFKEKNVNAKLLCIKLPYSGNDKIPNKAFSVFDDTITIECKPFNKKQLMNPFMFSHSLDLLRRKTISFLGEDMSDIFLVAFAEYDMNHITILEEIKRNGAKVIKMEDSLATYISRLSLQEKSVKQRIYLSFNRLFTKLNIDIGYSNYLFIKDKDFYDEVVLSEKYKTSHYSVSYVPHYFLSFKEILSDHWEQIYQNKIDTVHTKNVLILLSGKTYYKEQITKLAEIAKFFADKEYSILLKPHPRNPEIYANDIKDVFEQNKIHCRFINKEIPSEVVLLKIKPSYVFSDFSTSAWISRFLGIKSFILFRILNEPKKYDSKVLDFFSFIDNCIILDKTSDIKNQLNVNNRTAEIPENELNYSYSNIVRFIVDMLQ